MSNEYNELAYTYINKVKVYFTYLWKALNGSLHKDVQAIKEAAIVINEENAKLKKLVAKKTATVSVAKKSVKKSSKDSGK
jgi:hypothetical protein